MRYAEGSLAVAEADRQELRHGIEEQHHKE